MAYIEREDNMEKQRTIQEYVPGKQVTLAHLIANPDRDMCVKLGLDEEKTNAIGILTITPGEAAIISADIAIKSGSIELGFLDRFSGTLLLTGDLRQQAETIASRMSIDRYESELLPEDKAKNILKFQSKGSNVIMIGDGVNDAPALSYANVGVALGSTRTDVAMEAADITITQDNPLLVPGVIGLSKSTVKTIKENFAMVIGLNTFALVLGATGILAPIYASVLHNSTTILVVLNSLKLLKYDIKSN